MAMATLIRSCRNMERRRRSLRRRALPVPPPASSRSAKASQPLRFEHNWSHRKETQTCLNLGGGGGCGGCGTDDAVDDPSRMHLIMGAVSLWTQLPTVYLCTRPLIIPTSAQHPDNELPHSTNFSTIATVGTRLSPPRRHPWNSLDPHTRDIDHHVHVQLGNLNGCKTMGSRICATTGRGGCGGCGGCGADGMYD